MEIKENPRTGRVSVTTRLGRTSFVEARKAFEAAYVAKYGQPGYRFRNGMETVLYTENAFLWIEVCSAIPDYVPNYYHTDISEKWQMFKAGWDAASGIENDGELVLHK